MYDKTGNVLNTFKSIPINYKVIMRLKPYKRCIARLLKKNYYKDNKSLGFAMDFEMAY